MHAPFQEIRTRKLIVTPAQFAKFRDKCKENSKIPGGQFVHRPYSQDDMSPEELFFLSIRDQNRVRWLFGRDQGNDKPCLASFISLTKMDDFYLFYYRLIYLLKIAFPSKDIGTVQRDEESDFKPFLHLVPKPDFDDTRADLSFAHISLTLALDYAGSVDTILTTALRAQDTDSFLRTDEGREALEFLQTYGVTKQLIDLVADKLLATSSKMPKA